LADKAKKEAQAKTKKESDNKALEAAIAFNLKSEDWLKQNASLLPKGVSEIFSAAEKENYDSPIEKDSAIKAGIIKSFFEVQANLDLLTPSLKSELEDYLKLSKNGKQEKAQEVYRIIFEPAFEYLRKQKKTEALKKGFHEETDMETAYKERMMKLSRQHFLGEKANA
jgi:hypothetical protein